MEKHECFKCGKETGTLYRYCYEYESNLRGCGAEYHTDCSYKGKRCPNCNAGFLFTPSERKYS
jgi:DNA-directed RNA polymerase subunit RPC12/RpoP